MKLVFSSLKIYLSGHTFKVFHNYPLLRRLSSTYKKCKLIKILQLKERKKIEYEFGGQIWEKEQKLNMLKDIVNEDTKYTPTVAPKPTTFRTPAPRTKTYTTPGKGILIVTKTQNILRLWHQSRSHSALLHLEQRHKQHQVRINL